MASQVTSQAWKQQVVSAFEDEVSILAQLRHPNICLFLGVCMDPPNRTIVTELVSRGSLWDVLRIPGLFQVSTYMAARPPRAMLAWMEFKALVFDLRHHEKRHTVVSSSSARYDLKTPSTAASDSFRNLVQKQRLASSVVLDDVGDSTVISSVDQLPSVRRLKGKIVPSPVVKDAIVSVVARDVRGKNVTKLHPLDEKSTSLRFDDSTFNEGSSLLYGVGFNSVASDSVSALSGGHGHHHTMGHSKSGVIPQPSVDTSSLARLSVATQKAKVSNMSNPEDEYANKWARRKTQRDARIDREFKRKVRAEMLHTFKRVVMSSDKNEMVRSRSEQKTLHSLHSDVYREQGKERRKQLEDNLNGRVNAMTQRKAEEARYIRETLRTSAEMSRSLHREEIEAKRMHAREMTPFELDASSSTIIDIPANLITRVKTAKSLLAYEAARSEVKNFYESTLSDRIATFTRAKEGAIRKANLFGTPITIAPISAERLFSSDQSLSLGTSNGGDGSYYFDDEDTQYEGEGEGGVSLDGGDEAMREYIRQRGPQGHQLEEDSRTVMSPPTSSPKTMPKREKSSSTLMMPLAGKRPHRRSIQINGTSAKYSMGGSHSGNNSVNASPSHKSHEDDDNYSWTSTARSEASAVETMMQTLQRSPTAAALASRGVAFK
eukprot:gene24318-30640_t